MTSCIGITVADGLVGIADTCVISGTEIITARKVSTYETDQGAFFIMTSGLRSVRDKAIIYFDEFMEEGKTPLNRLYKAVNAFTAQIRRVAEEDKKALEESGVRFSINALIGGQMAGDKGHKLFLTYPEGNWVEIGVGTPFHIIGEGGYGKPVLDRALKYTDSMAFALKVGCLSFDSTRISAADVDFPIDVVLYAKDSHTIVEHRYTAEDLQEITAWWQGRLRESVNKLPSEWIDRIMAILVHPPRKVGRKGGKAASKHRPETIRSGKPSPLSEVLGASDG